jgi:DNA polymerase/3'-5' exonuclease PolX
MDVLRRPAAARLNLNAEVVALLEELAQISEITGETNRERAYRGAAASIKALNWSIRADPQRLTTEKIKGVGKGIQKKLLEWAETGSISELVKLRGKKEVAAYKTFSKILGVGPATIKEWLAASVYDLPSLRRLVASGEISLTDMQKHGLTHYDDLNERIPRDEVTRVSQHIIAVMKRINVTLTAMVCGSYRRGALSSGDIDIIATVPAATPAAATPDSLFLRTVQQRLETDPNFVALISSGRERLTFLYCGKTDEPTAPGCRSPWRVRQIDVLYLPYTQYWPGILYFTGSWEFNEAMRGWAKKRGFKLNQRGLFRVGSGGAAEQIVANSEEEIFQMLGLRYIAPEQRVDAQMVIPL